MDRAAFVATMVLLVAVGRDSLAQRRARSDTSAPGAETTTVTIAARIGSKGYQASGNGSCRHAPDASIRGVSASLWMVELPNSHGGLKRLNLTLWRPKDGGPDQLSLDLETSSGSHRIKTGEDESAGEGSVTILPSGPGGRLEINGKDAGGKPVQITIDCPTFAAVEAEGG
jgi:hypothetical protein